MAKTFIGQYEVISRLGAGGMGTVVLARAPDGRLVVIKQPHPGDDQLRELLINEARVGLRLRHPNIVETVDFFELEGEVSLVLSYVSGVSLQDLREAGPVPLETICRVGKQICEALDTLHHAADDMGRELHIVHRDVTPGNIMIGHDGDARLIDLGIAKSDDRTMNETQSGFLRGTIRYLAPEIFTSSRYSPQSDLWALGISLLDAALGRPALPGNDPEVFGRVMARRIFELAPQERIDPRLERILRKLLDYDHEKRPARGNEAAVMFSMLAKDLGDTKETTCAKVRVVAGVAAAPSKDNKDPDATELLVEQATKMFAAGMWGDPDESLPPPADPGRAGPEDKTEPSAPVPVAPAPDGIGTPAVIIGDPLDVGPSQPEPTPSTTKTPPAQAPSSAHPQTPSSLNDYLAGLRALEAEATGSAPVAVADAEPPPAAKPVPVVDAPPAAGRSNRVYIIVAVISALLLGTLGYCVGQPDDDSAPPPPATDAGAPVTTSPDSANANETKDPSADTDEKKPQLTAKERADLERQSEAYKKRVRALEKKRMKMPACYEEGRTKYFWYLNRKGTIVTATDFSEVPRRYRPKVRCAD